MKIAVATDDKKNIHSGHFGDSRYYLICEILNGEIFTEELRENPYASTQRQHGQVKNIMDLLNDCQIFLGKSIGAKSLPKIAGNNIDAIITTMDNIREALNAFLNSKDE